MSVSGGGTSPLSNSLIYLQSTVAVKIKFPQQSRKVARQSLSSHSIVAQSEHRLRLRATLVAVFIFKF